jgi:hypothetical protein
VNFNIVSFWDSFWRMGEEAPGETGAARVSFPAVLFCCIEGFFVLFVCVCSGAFGDRKIPSLIWPR